MPYLIKKELILQKKMLLFGMGYSIFLFIVFSNPIFQEFTYTMAAFGISYITIIGIAQAEHKNNSDMVINSLPITRREIVAAKYLSIMAAIAAALVIVSLVGLVFHQFAPPFNYRLITGKDVFTTFVSVLLLSALSLPIYFKTGAQWVRMVNVVIFLIIFFAPVQIAGFIIKNQQVPWIQNLIIISRDQLWLPVVGGSVFMLILLLASYFISLRIYKKKDF